MHFIILVGKEDMLIQPIVIRRQLISQQTILVCLAQNYIYIQQSIQKSVQFGIESSEFRNVNSLENQ